MSNDLNRWEGIGRLGRDPDIRQTNAGDTTASFSIACGWKGKNGEGTEWVNISAFGKLAEIIGQYLKKGSQVFVSGRLRTRKYNDRDGNERSVTEVVASDMQMLGGKADGQRQDAQQQRQSRPGYEAVDQSADYNDDIPF